MALNHQPHGWRVTSLIELRECSSMKAYLTSDIYSAVSLRAVSLLPYCSLFLQMIFHLFYNKLKLLAVYIMSHSWQCMSEQKPSHEVKKVVRRAPRQDCVEVQIWGRSSAGMPSSPGGFPDLKALFTSVSFSSGIWPSFCTAVHFTLFK
jgi:hypothetical protein